jgi:hypothetical protein
MRLAATAMQQQEQQQQQTAAAEQQAWQYTAVSGRQAYPQVAGYNTSHTAATARAGLPEQ